MTKRIVTLFSLSLIVGVFSTIAQVNLVTYDVPTSTTTINSATTASFAPGVVAGTLDKGPGLTLSSSSSGWRATSYNQTGSDATALAAANTGSDYWSFYLAAGPNCIVTVNGISALSFGISNSGPRNWALLSSTSSTFSTFTTIATYANPSSNNTVSVAASWSNALATAPITIATGTTNYFRIVGYFASATGGTGGIANSGSTADFVVTGSVQSLLKNLVWPGGDGVWDTTTSNWLDNGVSSVFGSGNDVTINAGGTLSVDAGGISAGTIGVSNSTSVVLTGGSITGTAIAKDGSGSLGLGSTGTYSSGIGVTGGTLQALANSVLNGNLTLSAGTTLDLGSTTNTVGNLSATDAAISGSGKITPTTTALSVSTNLTYTIAAEIAGIGSLTKVGTGTAILSGANSYTGDTIVSGGVLQTSGNERISDSSVIRPSTASTFRLGGNETVRALDSGNTTSVVDLQGNSLTIGSGSTSNSFSGSIQGSGTVTKIGTGIQSWDSMHTFSGGMTIKEGSIRMQGSGSRITNAGIVTLSSNAFGTGIFYIEGGRIYSSSLTSSATAGRTIYNSLNIKGDFAIGFSNAAAGGPTGDMTVSTNVTGVITTLASNSTVTVDSPTDWYQPISGPGNTFAKAGFANLHLRGPNTFGTLEVKEGNLYVRNTNDFANVIVRGGASLGYGSTAVTSPNLFGSATIQLMDGASFGQFATNGTGTDAERTISNPIRISGNVNFGLGGFGNYFSGNVNLDGQTRSVAIVNSTYLFGAVSNGGLTVSNNSASRTLYLNGNNTYAGGTTQNGGVINLGHDSGLGSGGLTVNSNLPYTNITVTTDTNVVPPVTTTNTNVTVASNTLTVSGNRIVANVINLAPGAAFTMDTAGNHWTQNGAISGSGAIIKRGSGTLRLAGPISYSGSTTVADGTLVVITNNLEATINTNSVSISFSNTPSVGTFTVLPGALIGSYPGASFTGLSDSSTATFNPSSGTVTVSAVVAPSGLSYLPSSASGTVGVPISILTPSVTGTVTNYSVSPALPTGLAIDPSSGVISGTPSISASSANYIVTAANGGGNATAQVTIAVAKATPTVTAAPSASAITSGQALSASILSGGTGSVAGSFAWTDSSIIPPVGTSSQSVTFTPSDTANYNTATTSVNVTVTSAGPTFDDAYPGKALSEVAPNGLSYLVNYAFGGNSTNGPQLPVQITSDPSKLTLQAFVRTNDSTLTVVGEVGASLTNWDTNNPLAGTATADQSGAPAGTERREFTVNTSGSRMFLRLKATK